MSDEELQRRAVAYAMTVIGDGEGYFEVPMGVALATVENAYASGFRAKLASGPVAVMGLRSSGEYARCPGCGDRADASHMSACAVIVTDRIRAAAWREGANFLLGAVRAQLGRRGVVDVVKLADAIEALS